ncbi:apolipoprotein L3-like, partial [Astyanax mexicanus]
IFLLKKDRNKKLHILHISSPDESLTQNIHLFTTAFDCSISELQDQVIKLREITDSVEEVHRNTTIGSLSGGVFGAAGGIMTLIGLALTPVTLGGSLGLTGLGIAVAAGAGVTGAVSTITDLKKQKKSRKKIKTILNSIQNKLNPMLKILKEIELSLTEIPRSQPTDLSTRNAQIGLGLGRGAGYAVETVRLSNVVELGAVVSGTVNAASAVTGIIASLFIVLDLFFIAKYTKELKEIDKYYKDGSERSNTVKFVHAMKETVKSLNETLDKLREARKQFTVNP